MPIRIAPALAVTADQRAALKRMSRSTSLPQRQVIAAKGLMLAADGLPNIAIARQLGVSPDRVRITKGKDPEEQSERGDQDGQKEGNPASIAPSPACARGGG